MKNIITFITILLTVTITATAQVTPIPPAGTYIYHSELNKFTGTWQWVSGTDTIKLRMNKENIVLPGLGGEDFLGGYYLYKKGAVIVHNSLQYAGCSYTAGRETINQERFPFGTGLKMIEISIDDSINNRIDHFELTLNSSNDQMVFKRIDAYDKILNRRKPLIRNYTLPANMVFKKVVPQVVTDL